MHKRLLELYGIYFNAECVFTYAYASAYLQIYDNIKITTLIVLFYSVWSEAETAYGTWWRITHKHESQ